MCSAARPGARLSDTGNGSAIRRMIWKGLLPTGVCLISKFQIIIPTEAGKGGSREGSGQPEHREVRLEEPAAGRQWRSEVHSAQVFESDSGGGI